MSNDDEKPGPEGANGSLNGRHPPKPQEDGAENVAHFPGAAERAARAAEAQAAQQALRTGAASEPMLNLPDGVKWLAVTLLLLMGLRYVLPDALLVDIYMHFGFVPARYSGAMPFDWRAAVAPVTHMFLHGGWLHIGVNIAMLMAFGSALEKTIGLKRAAMLFFASGFAGAAFHFVFLPQDMSPLIGASGGISGLFGGMLILMFHSGLLGGDGYRRLAFLIALWIGVSLLFGYTGMPGADGKIAWTAHVGGFVAGLALYPLIVRGENPRLE